MGLFINSLELEAVLVALHEFSGHLLQVVQLVLSDNTMAVSYLTKHGGTHSALLCGRFSAGAELSLQDTGSPFLGKWNVLTDSLLRRNPAQTEWALNLSVFQAKVVHFGLLPMIDLLMTPLNSKLEVFISPFLNWQHSASRCCQSHGTCLGQRMPFLPTVLVCDVRMKLRGLDLILIMMALWWPNQSWFLDLLELSINHPVEMPMTQTLLTQLAGG